MIETNVLLKCLPHNHTHRNWPRYTFVLREDDEHCKVKKKGEGWGSCTDKKSTFSNFYKSFQTHLTVFITSSGQTCFSCSWLVKNGRPRSLTLHRKLKFTTTLNVYTKIQFCYCAALPEMYFTFLINFKWVEKEAEQKSTPKINQKIFKGIL